MKKPKEKENHEQTARPGFEEFVHAAMETGKPPKAEEMLKPLKRKPEKGAD